jgi:excinuclease UvrABC nuclease subunit
MKNNYNNKNIMPLTPIHSYVNTDLQKSDICKYNKNKTGIYKWTHTESGKSYVGFAINLFNRFRDYYNISYLER